MKHTRAEAKALTRERLLDAAEQLFLAHGYAATAMEQIAAAAGVTKPAIYRHFDSKEDLFLALRERRARLADVTPLEDQTSSYTERLAGLGRSVAAMTENSDVRLLALQLEFRAVSLRRDDARERFAAEVRALVAAMEKADTAGPSLKSGVSHGEVVILSQLMLDGLREYRAYVPEIVTAATFATAFSLLAGLSDEA